MLAYFPSSCTIRPCKAYSLASSSLYNLTPTRSRKAFAQAAQDVPQKRRTHYKSDGAIERQ
ncbi:MAG: hypothetical protein MR364_03395 [Oscillospiraceae bacterium]|nr:hypothetical protein [Oscillospiraceae bacterium]